MKMGFVYLVGNREYGWYKIGYSDHLLVRLDTISRGCPVELQIIFTKEADCSRELERLLHLTFRAKRLRGEWFELTPQQVDQCRREVEEYLSLSPADRKAKLKAKKSRELNTRIRLAIKSRK